MSQVSIIVPNYNHSRYLNRRLDSILNQTFTDFECILLDDASTDNSVEILEQYVNRDSRFKLFVNQINSGSTFAQWNYGVSLSTSKYIWIAESDDFAAPNILQILVDRLEKNSDVVLAFSQSMLIDSEGESLGEWKYNTPIFDNSFILSGTNFIYNDLLYTNLIPNASAVVFRRTAYLEAGKAVPSLINNGDWHLWLKMLTLGSVFYTPYKLNYFRQHARSVTYKAKQDINFLNVYDTRIANLRRLYNQYLVSKKQITLQKLIDKNNLLLSYEWGSYGLHVKKDKKYFHSFYYIIRASFFPSFKSYFLKKYFFGNFYNYLFQK